VGLRRTDSRESFGRVLTKWAVGRKSKAFSDSGRAIRSLFAIADTVETAADIGSSRRKSSSRTITRIVIRLIPTAKDTNSTANCGGVVIRDREFLKRGRKRLRQD
jgi:hypothetical protein